MDVRVRKDENCYPMVAPGKSNAQMLGLPKVISQRPVETLQCSTCGTENPSNHSFCPACGTKL